MVEHVIESIKVACSNGNHGCTARITYYQREEHEKGCPHAPCFCPEAGCSFSGPTVRLLDHFSSKHKLHSPKVMYNKAFRIRIQVGSTILVGEDGCLFLVNMIPEALGGVMSVCCVQPHSTGSKFKCKLSLTSTEPHCSQVMEFVTRSTNLYDGLPKDCLPFLVPRVLLRGDGTSATAMVGVVLMPQ
jgi:E3 ubiquitin-protein ligase SIAH1